MIKKIKKICEEKYDEQDCRYHILSVVQNANLLSERLDADKEVVEIAAYLHDIGRSVKRGEFEPENDHHISGARISREILEDLGYSEDFISKVEHCVLTHRGRKGPEPETKEAKIVNCADAMAHFDTFLDLFALFIQTRGSTKNAVIKIRSKITRDWEKKLTLPEAKSIVKEKYDAIMLLIDSMMEYMEE